MRSLLQNIQQHLAASRQRRETEQFTKDLKRFITQPGKMFTLGMVSIKPTDLQFKVPDRFELNPVPGNYGVTEVFVPCTIGKVACTENNPLFWLHVKTVDTMITSVFITETRPYASPRYVPYATDASEHGAPAGDSPR